MPRVMASAMAMAVCSARRAMVSARARRVEFAGRTGEPSFLGCGGCRGGSTPRQRPHVMAGWGLGAGGRSLVGCGPGLAVPGPPGGGLALGRLDRRVGGGRRGGRLDLRAVAAVALAVARGAAGAVAGLARGPGVAGG